MSPNISKGEMVMKKLAILVIIMTLLVGSATIVSAADEPKTVTVTLSETPPVVNVGETVVLKAVTGKHGSSYSDIWSNANGVQTIYDEETVTYMSEALFKADKPGIYTISYEIAMDAGKSDTTFIGRVERTIEVTGTPVTLVGAEIRNLSALTPLFWLDGSLRAYQASGDIYSLWSDNTAVSCNSSVSFYFGVNSSSTNVTVYIYDDKNIKHSYLITVYKPLE